jgi:hypothetical protein
MGFVLKSSTQSAELETTHSPTISNIKIGRIRRLKLCIITFLYFAMDCMDGIVAHGVWRYQSHSGESLKIIAANH